MGQGDFRAVDASRDGAQTVCADPFRGCRPALICPTRRAVHGCCVGVLRRRYSSAVVISRAGTMAHEICRDGACGTERGLSTLLLCRLQPKRNLLELVWPLQPKSPQFQNALGAKRNDEVKGIRVVGLLEINTGRLCGIRRVGMKDGKQILPAFAHQAHRVDLLAGVQQKAAFRMCGYVRDRVALRRNAVPGADQSADLALWKLLGMVQNLVD